MSESQAISGFGTTLKYKSTGILIGEILDVKPNAPTKSVKQVTHHGSPNRTHEKIAGLIEPGTVVCDMNWIGGDAGQQAMWQHFYKTTNGGRQRMSSPPF